jgi:hypothetical protein
MKHNAKFLPAVIAALALSTHARAVTLDEAKITQIVKDVKKIDPAKGVKPASLNEKLQGEQSVRTGIESRTELLFNDHTITRLGANTHFSFSEGTRNMSLNSGVMLLQVPKGIGGAKIQTAAVTAALTGTSVMLEAGKDYTKLIVLEGECCLWPRAKKKNEPKIFQFRHKVCATAGQEIILRNGATDIPDPVYVNLGVLESTSKLLTGDWNSPLNNTPINAAKDGQDPKDYIPTNLAIIGAGTDVTIIQGTRPPGDQPPGTTPPPNNPQPPAGQTIPGKYGGLVTITSPNPYNIGGGSAINLDPTITTGGVTDYGRIYRGPQSPDGAASTYLFGQNLPDFNLTFSNQGGFPHGGVAVFRFSEFYIKGQPTFQTGTGNPNDLAFDMALISEDDISFGGNATTTLDFSPLQALMLATANGSISLSSEFTITGLSDFLKLYNHGAANDVVVNSNINLSYDPIERGSGDESPLPRADFFIDTQGNLNVGGTVDVRDAIWNAGKNVTIDGEVYADVFDVTAGGNIGGAGSVQATNVNITVGTDGTLSQDSDTQNASFNGLLLVLDGYNHRTNSISLTGRNLTIDSTGFSDQHGFDDSDLNTIDLSLQANVDAQNGGGQIILNGSVNVNSFTANAPHGILSIGGDSLQSITAGSTDLTMGTDVTISQNEGEYPNLLISEPNLTAPSDLTNAFRVILGNSQNPTQSLSITGTTVTVDDNGFDDGNLWGPLNLSLTATVGDIILKGSIKESEFAPEQSSYFSATASHAILVQGENGVTADSVSLSVGVDGYLNNGEGGYYFSESSSGESIDNGFVPINFPSSTHSLSLTANKLGSDGIDDAGMTLSLTSTTGDITLNGDVTVASFTANSAGDILAPVVSSFAVINPEFTLPGNTLVTSNTVNLTSGVDVSLSQSGSQITYSSQSGDNQFNITQADSESAFTFAQTAPNLTFTGGFTPGSFFTDVDLTLNGSESLTLGGLFTVKNFTASTSSLSGGASTLIDATNVSLNFYGTTPNTLSQGTSSGLNSGHPILTFGTLPVDLTQPLANAGSLTFSSTAALQITTDLNLPSSNGNGESSPGDALALGINSYSTSALSLGPDGGNGITLNGGNATSSVNDSSSGGSGGTLNVYSNGDLNVNVPITATSGKNGAAYPAPSAPPTTQAKGGSVNLASTGTVTVSKKIEVSSNDSANKRVSQSGGKINITSYKTSGTAINIANTGDLNAVLNAAAPGPGGQITFVSQGGDILVSGKVIATYGGNGGASTVDMHNNGASGLVQINSGAQIAADVIKAGALGNNGVLRIAAGSSFDASTTLKLYGGANGMVQFTGAGTVNLTSGNAIHIAAGTVQIDNGTSVNNVAGAGGTNVYSNTNNFAKPGYGNFTNSVNTGPLSGRPAY